ncbi:MAG: class I SAM-dependent methyltransferase [Anaerolineae bacterium]|nr:MAG: class I SAM-dependent methyltransferase [Anaerolineae bacterium]
MNPDLHAFSFGKNWRNFVSVLNEEHIYQAQDSLRTMLRKDRLDGLRFLDAGCGSGLFSLAALRLEAREVVSFDSDSESLQCAHYLNEKYGPLPQWKIAQGSVLDRNWLTSLGKFDVVYSWGVLHHTGDLWQALDNIIIPVSPKGTLFISIYNDQGIISKFWKTVKRIYNRSPKAIGLLMATCWYIVVIINKIILGVARMQSPRVWFQSAGMRGMNIWYDAVDWVGGYPFETARSEDVFRFYRDRGFALVEMILKKGSGCNEYVFTRNAGK